MSELPKDMKSLFADARVSLGASHNEVLAVREHLVAALPTGSLATAKSIGSLRWWGAGSALVLVASVATIWALNQNEHVVAKTRPHNRDVLVPSAEQHATALTESQVVVQVAHAEAPRPTAEAARTQRWPARPAESADETTLLLTAQRAYRDHEFDRAMSAVQLHARLYPQSTFAKEREALRLITSCALHDSADALAHIAEFYGTPYSIRIRNACNFE